MIYFLAMGKRRSQRDLGDNYSNILVLILFTPFIILKWIGDLIILLVKEFANAIISAYKLIIHIINRAIIIIFSYLHKWSSIRIKVKPTKKLPKVTLFKIYHPVDAIRRYLIGIKHKAEMTRLNFISWIYFHKIPNKIESAILKLKYFLIGSITVAIIASVYQVNYLVKTLPKPTLLTVRDIPTSSRIYDRNGKILYEIYADENRTPVQLSEIPDIVKQATIAIEDKDFYSHNGFSLKGIIRAFIHNINSSTIEGGSTLTQQLVRSALLTPEKTFTRKLKELALSIWTEHIYTKDQILEMYLNQVPYGGTSWGIEAASETYFGKKVKDLTLGEAALLAGLPAAPSVYSPFGNNPQFAKTRQEEVLDKMVEMGVINPGIAIEAKDESLNFRKPMIPIIAPHFVMYVKNILEEQYGARIVEKGGLRIITTLDSQLQEKTQNILSEQIEGLKPLRVGNGAVLITNPRNGEILTMVGSANYFDIGSQGNVNVTTSLRQPGSSIKVVNYAAALNSGYTAASILDDSPVSYKSAGFPSYTPVNYDGKFHGKISLRTALASSYNVPAVKVLGSIGVAKMIEQGKMMGITSWNDEGRFGLSLTLGGGEVTMLDMAKVFGTLANGGVREDLTPFISITNYRGESLPLPQIRNEIQATTPEIAFIISDILSDNRARTPAFGPNSALVIAGKTVAVKTGTSDNKRDNWTIGYTQDFVTTVWVGNNDNSPMHPTLTSGITGAAPIWNTVMDTILENKENKPFPVPSEIISMPCLGRTEYFIAGTEPKGGCVAPPTHTPEPTR